MSVNAFSSCSPLSVELIKDKFPAIFNENQFSSSKRYNFISTKTMIDSMEKEGFYPYNASQVRTRSDERRPFTRHVICFRHKSSFEGGDHEIVPQVVIMNSHDGTSCYKIYCGFFRFVCANGLIVGSSFSALKVHHKGIQNTMDNVIDASFKVLEQSKNIMQVIDLWKGVHLDKHQRMDLAVKTHELKFNGKSTPITPEQFLTVHNGTDYEQECSLWNTYNILQENLIKGGLSGWKSTVRSKKNERIKVTTRGITNIKQNIDLNAKLWDMAERTYYDLAA